mgnify:CR=1 FL=1
MTRSYALRVAGVIWLLQAISGVASAQLSTSVTLSSDVRFRGQSITDEHAAITADLGYDDPSGVYLAANSTTALVHGKVEPVNVQGNIGFAHRLASGPTIDIGVLRSDYREYYGGRDRTHFTEAYAGVLTNHFAFYLRYSPDFLRPGLRTLYGEINATTEVAARWHLSAHIGAQARLAGPPLAAASGVDWKLGVARETGPFELQLAVSGRSDTYGYRAPSQRTAPAAVTVSLTWRP